MLFDALQAGSERGDSAIHSAVIDPVMSDQAETTFANHTDFNATLQKAISHLAGSQGSSLQCKAEENHVGEGCARI
jgi:hypothetical protein